MRDLARGSSKRWARSTAAMRHCVHLSAQSLTALSPKSSSRNFPDVWRGARASTRSRARFGMAVAIDALENSQ